MKRKRLYLRLHRYWLIVTLQMNHSSVAFQVCGHSLQEIQFFHRLLEVGEFFKELFWSGVVFFHRLHLGENSWTRCGVFIVCRLPTWPFSVIEEKGEGFEKRKKDVLGQMWFTFNLLPLHVVVRLKTLVAYKKVTASQPSTNGLDNVN